MYMCRNYMVCVVTFIDHLQLFCEECRINKISVPNKYLSHVQHHNWIIKPERRKEDVYIKLALVFEKAQLKSNWLFLFQLTYQSNTKHFLTIWPATVTLLYQIQEDLPLLLLKLQMRFVVLLSYFPKSCMFINYEPVICKCLL